MGYTGNYVCKLDWQLIARLYAAGDGTKAIAKAIGAGQASIRQGLIKRGLYQFGRNRKRNQVGVWAGYYDAEIAPLMALEKQHQAWWRKAYPSQKNSALAYYYANHEANKAACAERARNHYHATKHTPEFKAMRFARRQLLRIAQQTKRRFKQRKTQEYLGCSYAQATEHITKLLPMGWTWANYGRVWEIDHIIPLSAGQLTDHDHLNRVCHYTNLRPMSVTENRRRKRGKWHGHQCAA